jgi:GT2 family glycosyltransferase
MAGQHHAKQYAAMNSKASRIKSRWLGALEGMHNSLLYGWAFDSEEASARVVLEICLDGEIIDCAIADMARSDLTETLRSYNAAADNCHGFVIDLGKPRPGANGKLTVRVANTGITLDGVIDREQPTFAPRAATSSVFTDGGVRLHGWALEAGNSQRQLTIRAYLGSQLVGTTVANMEHPALRGEHIGPHGFDLDLPVMLADGQPHSIRVMDEDGNELNGSPVTVCCYANGVKAALPAKADSLLHELADAYERHLPRSVGMRQYDEWRKRFEIPNGVPPSTKRAAIIVTPGANSERSVDSLRKQLGQPVKVIDATARPFAEALTQAIASGADVIGCLRAGDTLPPHAIGHALEGFTLPGTLVVYTDSEFQGAPWFKPAWDSDYALASDYPLELLLVRASLARQLASADNSAEFSWQALASAAKQDCAIVHVPRVLYQFHSPLDAEERSARETAAQNALKASEPAARLERLADVPAGYAFAARRVSRELTAEQRACPVSLVIPTRDGLALLERCISTIQKHTAWDQLEIIVIDNGSVEKETKAYFRKIAKTGVKVLAMPGAFNFADLNNRAIVEASGEVIGLINNDIEALHDGWLEEIMSQLLRPGVAAVGAKLLWPNGMVQHGGVLLGVGNVAGHFGNRLAANDWGDHGRNQLVQQMSGVTAACLFLRKADYFAVGGMDPIAFPVAFNDVDLCLKLRAMGKAIVWTPHARLLHAESASRGHEDTPQKKARAAREIEQLRRRWGGVLQHDPAYHPSLNLDPHSHAFGGLALPPRARKPRTSNPLMAKQ